jgi:hypothetical protein
VARQRYMRPLQTAMLNLPLGQHVSTAGRRVYDSNTKFTDFSELMFAIQGYADSQSSQGMVMKPRLSWNTCQGQNY